MSAERIRFLLDSDTLPPVTTSNNMRLQITPSMMFTCNGTVTKWIFGAEWSDNINSAQVPELQIWRKMGNNTYEKVHGTRIEILSPNDNRVYEYDSFKPIEFRIGDIFGVNVPPVSLSKLQLLSEETDSPTNYYLPPTQETVFDITSPLSMQQNYHPLVTGRSNRVCQ